MTSASDPPDIPAANRRRLDGWKEIAAYLGRGVRTVQRWERELHLPVRRIDTGRGQVTYAFVDELEQWRESAAAKKATSETGANGEAESNSHATGAGTDPGSAPEVLQSTPSQREQPAPPIQKRGGRKPVRVWAAVAVGVFLVAVAGVVGWNWISGSTTSPRPASVEVVDDALRVLDAGGRLLWEHRFEFPLTEAAYIDRSSGYDRPSVAISDVDGNGSAEVLFVAEPWRLNGLGLFCFNADGSIRFRHIPARAVMFGGKTYAPPWRGVSVYVSGQAGRPRDIWFVSTHLVEFPTLLEKLDAVGQVTSEYLVERPDLFDGGG